MPKQQNYLKLSQSLAHLFVAGGLLIGTSTFGWSHEEDEVPFPFSEKVVAAVFKAPQSNDETNAEDDSDDLLWTLTDNTRGHVPMTNGKLLPEPVSLRPRNSAGAKDRQKVEPTAPVKKGAIQPVSNTDDEPLSNENPITLAPFFNDAKPETDEPLTAPIRTAKQPHHHSGAKNASQHGINNACSDDDITCGDDTLLAWFQRSTGKFWKTDPTCFHEKTGVFQHQCGSPSCDSPKCQSAVKSLPHLGRRLPGHGHCDSCGFLTCTHKYYSPYYIDGWVSVGATLNSDDPPGRDNKPLAYNDWNNGVTMNQAYLSVGRRVNYRKTAFDWGGQVDVLYGSDYYHTSALGLETRITNYQTGEATLNRLDALSHWNKNEGFRRDGTIAQYGLSVPQAYMELYLPDYGTVIKGGHFYGGMGVESAMSPKNFFYSHSYAFMYGMPTTLTGMTATTKISPRLSVMAGASRGWDVFDKSDEHVDGLVGLQWNSRDKKTVLDFTTQIGRESIQSNDVRYLYVLSMQHKLSSRLKYAVEQSFGYENGVALVADGEDDIARWVSVAQYLQCDLTDKLSAGFRAEWFRDEGHSRIHRGPIDDLLTGKNYYELTLGLNWKPTRYITIRPEVRYDWSDVESDTGGVYSDKRQMFTFGVDGVLRF